MDDVPIRSLYFGLLACWNRRDATAFAARFDPIGQVVGFDGSSMNGQAEIETMLGQIFADHPTAEYVGVVRSVRFLTPGVAVLRADAGMAPRGQSDINSALNAIQSLVAIKQDDHWRIALFQNTPAAFHGRPDASAKLTEELRRVLHVS
jgi:uncharacterized protein (TIGR02246 family)